MSKASKLARDPGFDLGLHSRPLLQMHQHGCVGYTSLCRASALLVVCALFVRKDVGYRAFQNSDDFVDGKLFIIGKFRSLFSFIILLRAIWEWFNRVYITNDFVDCNIFFYTDISIANRDVFVQQFLNSLQ